MISLVALILAYLTAVVIGSRSKKIGSNALFLLALITVIQVIVVLISMFLMAPPPGGHPGQG